MNDRPSYGLYIGRFQPFHLGHLSAIQQALKHVDGLYIGIGSSQYSHTSENPFTAQERKEMIELGLKEENLKNKCQIFFIPDIHAEEKWVSHVKGIVPPFDKVFVGNEGLVKLLFEKGNVPVVTVEQEFDISATSIRKAIQEKGPWEKMVTPSVANFLIAIKANDRLNLLLA